MDELVVLRIGTKSDATRIARMSRDLIETGLGWSWTAARVLKSMRSSETTVLVADIGHQLIGFAIMDFDEYTAHLNLLAVDPAYQGIGLGHRLVAWLEKSAWVAGIVTVYLEVRATNRGARAFYVKLGYQELDRLAGYYAGREPAICMARNLRLPICAP